MRGEPFASGALTLHIFVTHTTGALARALGAGADDEEFGGGGTPKPQPRLATAPAAAAAAGDAFPLSPVVGVAAAASASASQRGSKRSLLGRPPSFSRRPGLLDPQPEKAGSSSSSSAIGARASGGGGGAAFGAEAAAEAAEVQAVVDAGWATAEDTRLVLGAAQTGRPDMSGLFEHFARDAKAVASAAAAAAASPASVLTCGPQGMIDQVADLTAQHCMAFHAEVFHL
jgi:hypothetical protein